MGRFSLMLVESVESIVVKNWLKISRTLCFFFSLRKGVNILKGCSTSKRQIHEMRMGFVERR